MVRAPINYCCIRCIAELTGGGTAANLFNSSINSDIKLQLRDTCCMAVSSALNFSGRSMEDDLSKFKKIEDLVFSFFCESADFNGIALRSISEQLGLGYKDSIDKVKELVKRGIVDIQSSTNPTL